MQPSYIIFQGCVGNIRVSEVPGYMGREISGYYLIEMSRSSRGFRDHMHQEKDVTVSRYS